MDPIGMFFLGVTLLLVVLAVVLPQIEQARQNQDE